MPAPVFLLDQTSLAILECSDEARRIFEHESLELLGTSFLQLHNPADIERASHALRQSGDISYSADLVSKSGAQFWTNLAASVVECDGQVCLAVIAEVSKAPKSATVAQAELQILSSRVPVVLWTVDRNLKFISSSGSGTAVLPRYENRTDLTLYEYFQTSDKDFPPVANHLRALEGESVSYEFEFDSHLYECWLEPSRDQDGSITGVIGVAIDNTEQKRVQRQLRLSEETNRAIIENAMDIIYTHDLRGNFTSVSSAATQLTGYTREEALMLNLGQVVAPEFLEGAQQHIQAKLRGETVDAYQLDLVAKDGTRIPVEVSTRLIMRDGAPVGIQGIARDVRARREAELALRESESRFRAVAETTASAIFICNSEYFEYVNSAGEEITGFTLEELKKLKYWEIAHPDFRDLVRLRGQSKLAGDLVPTSRYEFKIVTKNGSERWLDFTTGTIENNGKIALLGTAFDITERKHAEQELQIQKAHLEELFQTAPEGIVVLDSSGEVLSANREFLVMFGFEWSDIQGKNIDNFIVPDWKRKEAAMLNATMKQGRSSSEETVRCRKDGSLIDVSILATSLTVSQGHLGRFVIYRDISGHRRSERLRDLQFTTTQILADAPTLEDAAGRLLQALGGTLDWEYARMWLVDGSLHCMRSWRADNVEALEQFATPAATSEAIRTVLTKGESLWVADLREVAIWPKQVVEQTGVRSLFAFPMRNLSGIQGVFEFITRTPRQPDFELMKVMNDIGSQTGQFVDRKNAERAVNESESKFRAVADTAASAIFILAGERFLYVNRSTEKISGYSREELQRMDLFRLVHPDDLSMMRTRSQMRTQGIAPPVTAEFRIMTRTGEVVWVEYSSSVISFEGQTAVLATAFDVTGRKKAELLQSALFRITSLASSKTELQELYKGIHDIVGELMYAKNFYIALLDETTNTIEFPYFLDEEDPEPPPPQQRSRGLTDYVLRTGEPLFANPNRFEELRASGEVESRGAPSIDWVGVPLKSGGKAFGVLTVQSYSENVRYGIAERDILMFVSQQVARAIENRRNQEALKQSEARYRSQVESALYGLYRSSIDGKFLDVNPALVQMLGYDSAEELLAIDLGRDLYFDALERQRILLEVGDDKTIKGVEAHWRRKDGRAITVRLSGRGGVRYPGEPLSFEMIAEDVTERRQLEEQLQHSQKMEAVGRLAGGIAHDFNNLLTVIKGYSDLMLAEIQPGDKLRSEVEEVRRAADRAATLTRQLLAFSRRQVLEPRVLDLNSVVTNMDRLLRRLLGDDVEFYCALDSSLGMVKADPGQVEQVIMNLAVNARDAMPTGGRLTIETHNVELDEVYAKENGLAQSGRYVMLAVSDTGFGMEAETRKHIFEPFFTTKETGKGTGLGLSTVYGIVKQSGGHITCYSELNKGTAFKVYLPYVVGSRPDNASQDTGKYPRTQSASANETVLLVEDEDGVRALVRQVLERDGYKVLEARNGAEAMLASEQYVGKIHLLLSDVVLAQMSGREIAREIIFKRKDTRVLFISGYTEEAIVRNGVLEAGTEFLQKPFTPAALSRKVRDILNAERQASGASSPAN